MANATLVVMAAGMGSRFGGVKQLEPVGKHGEVLLDYSVYDALRAGFDKVVFIIKKEIEADFKALAGDRIARHVEVEYVFQTTPPHRKKPYGTGDAILCTENVVDSPFAVINADDFYGADAFRQVYQGLQKKDEYCMVGYRLANTLSENGSVSRGVCDIKDGYLAKVTEMTAITKDTDLDPDTVVSMNMWGLQPDIFPELKSQFAEFLTTADITKDEFYIPFVVDRVVKEGKKQVSVYRTSAVWYGMTYREDKEKVTEAIAKMTADGEYPEELWG
ncbi:MAG: nucleotidyltransferase [Ruminococcaceae bacterium]|nr:nucleotidyltransferase [Oscillospiraceae bacterium]